MTTQQLADNAAARLRQQHKRHQRPRQSWTWEDYEHEIQDFRPRLDERLLLLGLESTDQTRGDVAEMCVELAQLLVGQQTAYYRPDTYE